MKKMSSCMRVNCLMANYRVTGICITRMEATIAAAGGMACFTVMGRFTKKVKAVTSDIGWRATVMGMVPSTMLMVAAMTANGYTINAKDMESILT